MVALTAWALSALIMVPIFMYANTLQIGDKVSQRKQETEWRGNYKALLLVSQPNKMKEVEG